MSKESEICQSVISGILGQMMMRKPTNSLMITRALLATDECKSLPDLEPLREAYRSYIGDETTERLLKFGDLSERESAIIVQASLHYGVWTKRALIRNLNFSGKCALITVHPLQFLRAIIAPIADPKN